MHLVHERAARLRGDLPRTPSLASERGFIESTLGIAYTVGATLQVGTRVSEDVDVVRVVVWRHQSELFQTTCRQHVRNKMLTGVVDRKVGRDDLGGEPEGDNESNEELAAEHRYPGEVGGG